jgi:hypothetical protein
MSDIDRLWDAAEDAVFACLPILPLQGSDGTGYQLVPDFDPVLVATDEEWASAAQSIADLHRLIAELREAYS